MHLQVTVPELGEGIVEATIVEWFKAVGDPVQEAEPIAAVETDKASMEIESPFAGTIVELLAEVGESPEVGDPIALVAVDQ